MESIGNNDANRDELIIQQQREIEKEISDSTPLVSEQLALTCLQAEYKGDVVFTDKIQELSKKYKFIRRTRPDVLTKNSENLLKLLKTNLWSLGFLVLHWKTFMKLLWM
ncbi:hypothetical protein AWZ03_014519 [Drosophila navojoa]|uniref:Uncharacterized protein n=1 Tax=Drosophila navojoa TaxID=7232 RepID=A0A484AR85_DRONA|nr:hypothetical protein AWZ03_014519 [Drosophila navojoa]